MLFFNFNQVLPFNSSVAQIYMYPTPYQTTNLMNH